MTRRSFFRRIGTAATVVAAARLIPSPIAAVAEWAARRSALAYLLDIWRTQHLGLSSAAVTHFVVSRSLYAAFESELIARERFLVSNSASDYPGLAFKSGTICSDPTLCAWGFVARTYIRGAQVRFLFCPDAEPGALRAL